MEKRYLLAPGPTEIPPEVLLKMAEPIIHHRNPLFEAVMEDVRADLKYVFGTKQEVLIFTASGTGAMEGAVTNLLSAGDKAVCVRAGKFGERWASICTAYGVQSINVDVPWGMISIPPGSRPPSRSTPTQESCTCRPRKHRPAQYSRLKRLPISSRIARTPSWWLMG